MKIGNIIICLEYDNEVKVELRRTDKQWYVIDEKGQTRGLQIGEIEIANFVEASIEE